MGCVIVKALCCNKLETNNKEKNNQTENKSNKNLIPLQTMYTDTEASNQFENNINFEKSDVNSFHQVKIKTSQFVFKKEGFPSDYYTKQEILGKGAYGTVCKVLHKSSGQIRSMKIISKSNFSNSYTINYIEDEIKILKNLDHPNIIKIFEFFVDCENFYIVTEYCSEGSLFDKLIQIKYFNEFVVKLLMFQLISAVNYLHSQNVIHGDLKLENILIDSLILRKKLSFVSSIKKDGLDLIESLQTKCENFSKFEIKLIDFGCSKIFTQSQKRFSDIIGTVFYVAPEVLANDYSEKSDIWSCGVIMYLLLCGRMPFTGETDEDIADNITRGEFNFEHKEFDKVSCHAKDLIEKMLTYNQNERPSASQILNHPFFNFGFDRNNLYNDEIDSEIILTKLKKLSACSKFQQAVLTFITHNFVEKDEVLNLKKIFKLIDTNSDGKISREELLWSYYEIGINIKNQELEDIIKIIDDDNNGYIEYEEFLRATVDKKTLLSEINLKQAFDLFDEDKSGIISFNEIKNIIGAEGKISDEVITQILKEINKESGEITYDEFKELMLETI